MHKLVALFRYTAYYMHMNYTDRKILSALVANGRATQQDLAEAGSLSPSAASRRQKALEEEGIIRGYRADVNLARLGAGATVMITIALDSQSDEAMRVFETAVSSSPSVIRCHLMSGRDDYLIVVKAGSIEDYERIHRKEIATLPHISRIETAFALREIVNRAVPSRLLV